MRAMPPSGDEISPTEARAAADSPVVVGTLAPNGFSLHDMAGNVAEWVQDWWAEGYQG